VVAPGAHPIPVGIVGDDPEGQRLIQFFTDLGIDISSIVVAKSYRTPSKTRILAGAVHSQRQQIVRLDAGAPLMDEKARDATELKFKAAMKQAQALLVSDYGYNLVTPQVIARTWKNSVPATIDSRFSLLDFSGMTAATPNEPEVEAALGVSIGNDAKKLELAGRTLLRKLKHDALLITRGKDGMA